MAKVIRTSKSKLPVEPQHNALWSGITLCIVLAVISFISWLAYKPISSLMWAFIYSIAIANVIRLPERLRSGINFCSREFLMGTIAAFGIVTSALVWLQVGVGVLNAVVIIFFSYFFGLWLGKKLGLNNRLATLIGVGTCICGASAIAAIGPAIKAKEEEMGLAVACITFFGLVAMFSYPFLYANTVVGRWLGLNLNVYGIWIGSGVHETAQVIAAAGALNPLAIGPALMVKSIRIFMIGPMILVATLIFGKIENRKVGGSVAKIAMPAFGIVFVLNSLFGAFLDAYAIQIKAMGFDWLSVKNVLSGAVFPFLLSITFAGVGAKVRLRSISKLGVKPFAFGALMATLAGGLALILAIAVSQFVPVL
jgi:uncharacterized integral membrane protein (TIGR00698 family)